ncbi:MAG: lipoprotein [Mediterranea sp.]|jgi:hypothetical protein|nr:lipoprotein [Mediterranea sp.]
MKRIIFFASLLAFMSSCNSHILTFKIDLLYN